ncbi:hypothetical protein GZ77_03725 [Endozoicomonas montiporae]|uniref:TauD/TfdA-like domain-containing protein n=2 Tax=Endozoicomonas montiporae TaxID=1027273 RepID=A0A081NB69_9GAMM|nr:TauD/TfdA family dioxygenase [Endozoicomonas montiporae]AMO56591.1 putative taurine catabolism dioxygenase [Endozoicomonas montiporae CL-33]KEQ15692.1 hypothetical protein GZ77_03725 [Endozoicomonas montiporae]
MSSLHLSSHAIPLRAPEYCYFTITKPSHISSEQYKLALLKKGIVIISLGFKDDSATTMERIVSQLGQVHEHDSQGRTVWDVKIGGQTGHEAMAISHSDNEFCLHNDGAFELDMPGYFGLYVVESDKLGGGNNILVCADRVIENLSEKTFRLLSSKKFRLRVPEEFHKNDDFIEATLIDDNHAFRYRHDIIERSSCTAEELEALKELELQLSLPQNMIKVSLEDGQIMLLDNQRYLHARTRIKDKNRHLKRIRFNMP